MRTHFLNNDYFALPPPQTFPFLHFPIPRLPPPPPSAVHHLLRFDPPIHLPLHLDPFPVHATLSTFLPAILPHRIRINSHDLATPSNPAIEAEVIFEDRVSEADIKFSNESKIIAFNDKNDDVYETIQFEIPELGTFLENVCVTETERMQMLSLTPEVENTLEMLKPEPSRQYPYEALESVLLVEDVISEYLMGENAYSLEGHISVQHQPHSDKNKFLILEVDEESLGTPTCLSLVDIVDSYFENIRSQNFDEQYQSVIEGKELLGSMKHNMMEFFSDECVSKKSLELSDLFPERDFMNMLETEHVDRNIGLQRTSHANSDLILNFVTFQEFVFLDEDLMQTFEAFYDLKASDDLVSEEWMLRKEFNFKSFDELIVSNETALTDDTFKSLPVPVISDHKKMITLHDIIVEQFSSLKTRPLSASDGIYLSWDLLEEDRCNCKISNWYQNILAKIDLNNQDFGGTSFDDGKLAFDLVFCDDTIDECDIKQNEEFKKLLSDGMPLVDNHPVEVASGKVIEHVSSKQGSQEQLPEQKAERASLLFKSLSEISNLDYFLNPKEATGKGNCNYAVESTNANVCIPKVSSNELKVGAQSQVFHTVLHRVRLSDNIVALAGYFEKSYLAILHSDTEMTKMHNSDADYLKLLGLQKHKLIKYHVNGNNMAFAVLCAIKQAAWYLCFYGLHPAFLYLDKLCQNLEYLKSKLGFLQSLIKDEKGKVDSNVTMAHPSLTIVKKILQSYTKQNSSKTLIVAEEVFWYSLKNILLSLGLSFIELNDSYRNQPYANTVPKDTDTKTKELLISDCLLVSHKHVFPLFPLNKFDIILEYGGPYDSSRISELSQNLVELPHLHFLRVELDGHAALEALCEGVEMPPNIEMLMESETRLIFNHKESMNQNLERLLNFCPVEQSYDKKSSKVAPEADNHAPLIPAVKTEHDHKSMEVFPGTVMIVNTQNVDKEMIMSRRSSYQLILAMEKEGIQVVERDLDLPVDIILSSAICLAQYDSRNLGKKATPATEASSSLPLCIENIATDVLTLLSFYFRGCFLVFEGELNFLSTVMESSDRLYAAATSLGIDLQIFFSYSPELTNEVIVSCIKSATNMTRGLYPKMPDSVTFAESFLTEFPGINPLTAHYILSSGVMLNEFLAWSHEQRMHVLEKYHVPEESISLFSVFCRYGEPEDSKSIMTDCSSSVSSGLDSDRCCLYEVENERKRKNPISSDQIDEPSLDELLQFETLNQVVEAVPDSSTLPKPFDFGMSKNAGRSSDFANASFSMSEFFSQKQSTGAVTMRNLSGVSYSPGNCKAPHKSEKLKQPSLSLKNKELAQNEILGTALMGKGVNWHNFSNSEKLHGDIRGEVVDLTDNPLFDKSFATPDSMYFTSLMAETDQMRKNKIARKLSFDNSSHPASSSSKIWRSFKDTRGQVDNYPEPDFREDVFPPDFKPRKNIVVTQASMRNLESPFKEEISHLGITPFSFARQSAIILKNSPWTTEFINKVKEKSGLRQKSLSSENSGPYFGYPGSMSKTSKRINPSVIDLFKYQPNRASRNVPEQKRQKQSGPSSNSIKKARYSTST
ncbi:Protein SHORTAGE IN CHIASMATA 1 [Glycine max]|uniref:protein SHORTAGE IN CHIASMATA 1-like n=1 Tax=Glycine max TaxID=3847 RepID=UPI00023D6C6B|nr:protein SHORTAGE IN CHIASMATA 1-like [Glycine max]KAH1206953.1 Protein SHORTAGE IN CHIASMATA 1 [Glycine max]